MTSYVFFPHLPPVRGKVYKIYINKLIFKFSFEENEELFKQNKTNIKSSKLKDFFQQL